MQKGKKNLILQDFSLVRRVFCYGNDKEICMHAIFFHKMWQKSNFHKTRKPENPKGPNPNPKADLSTKPEPENTRKIFGKLNPMNPNPKARAKPQPEPEEF